jgi:hypothetical protein
MKYIVYQTVCTVNRKIYIGVHKTYTEEFDGYLGCGVYSTKPATYNKSTTPFKAAVNKYGPSKFIRTTLKEFDEEQAAYDLEAELVTEEFVRREDTYNLALGGRDTRCAKEYVKVYMYDLDGNFEREFESLKQASVFLGSKNTGHLPRAIKQGHQYLGHQFSYEKLPYMKKLKHRKMGKVDAPNIGEKVGRYDEDWNLLEVFENMTQCVKAGYKNAKLVAIGKREKCKGFRFKYLN